MGQLIEVDFKAGRRGQDPVEIARRIRAAIRKVRLSQVSVRTFRAQSVIEPDRIVVTVKGPDTTVFNQAWLDWAIDPLTKHRPRPPEAELPRFTPKMVATLQTLRTIIRQHPGDYESELVLANSLYVEALAIRQARLRLSTS